MGFHHDPDGMIRESGVLDVKVIKEVVGGDTWRLVKWKYGNHPDYKPSSQFPDNWSEAKIFEKVEESIKNRFDVSKTLKFSDRYVIKGYTSEGVLIESVVKIKEGIGEVITCYPNLDEK